MSDIINLNKARKAKAKQRKAAQAAENRVFFGRSTLERKQQDLLRKRDSEKLEAHRLSTAQPSKTIDGEQ